MANSTDNVSSTTASPSASFANMQGNPRLGTDVIDWSSPNEFTNVVFRQKGREIYYAIEILALNSDFFHKGWEEAKKKVPPDDGQYSIDLNENVDFDVFALILKNLAVRDKSWINENIEPVMHLAKGFRMELVLRKCEAFLIENDINPVLQNHYANYFDMNELQHVILEAAPPFNHANTTFCRYVTSSAFLLPEIQTDFQMRNIVVVNKNENSSSTFNFKALIDWHLQWKFKANERKLSFCLQPAFYKNCTYKDYKSINWMIVADFQLVIRRTQSEPKTCHYVFKPGKTKIVSATNLTFNTSQKLIDLVYEFRIKIKCIKGLRYYVRPETLYNFSRRAPSSDVVVQTKSGRLFANLNILAFHSFFFQGIKNHISTLNIDEATNLPLIHLEDIEKEHFLELLRLIYPSQKEITLPSFEQIFGIIDRFLFCGLLKDCEQVQIDEGFPLGVRTLQMALDFKMENLQKKYLDNFHTASQIHALSADIAYQELSDQAKLLLHEKLMNIPLTEDDDNSEV